ncbi:MAG: hypothetical protein AAFX44_13760 [Pseudomonadota bacterium]
MKAISFRFWQWFMTASALVAVSLTGVVMLAGIYDVATSLA